MGYSVAAGNTGGTVTATQKGRTRAGTERGGGATKAGEQSGYGHRQGSMGTGVEGKWGRTCESGATGPETGRKKKMMRGG